VLQHVDIVFIKE